MKKNPRKKVEKDVPSDYPKRLQFKCKWNRSPVTCQSSSENGGSCLNCEAYEAKYDEPFSIKQKDVNGEDRYVLTPKGECVAKILEIQESAERVLTEGDFKKGYMTAIKRVLQYIGA